MSASPEKELDAINVKRDKQFSEAASRSSTEQHLLPLSPSRRRSTNLLLDQCLAYLRCSRALTPRAANRVIAWRTEVVNNIIRINGRIMMHWWACPKCRRGRGARRYPAFIFQKRVLFIRDGRISLVQAPLQLADATSQALKLRRMLLFNSC